MGKTVNDYLESLKAWRPSLLLLREIMLSAGLEEAIKWGRPTYSLKGKNIIGLSAFKQYTGIWFFQGSFLKDKEKKLQNAQETTKAMRQWRFHSLEEIEANRALIAAFVQEAIENEKQGKRLKPQKNTAPLVIPAELQAQLDNDKSLATQFSKLSLSGQREYCNYIAEAKRAATKAKRIEKIVPLISVQKGLHDQYKK